MTSPIGRPKAVIDFNSVLKGGLPELFFGLVGATGTPLAFYAQTLEDLLEKRGYAVEVIRLGKFLDDMKLGPAIPPGATEFERLRTKMTWGNDLRKKHGGDVLALLAASAIAGKRPTTDPRYLRNSAFIVHQLKHPDEVVALRRIYGSAFHLIGVYSARRIRHRHLRLLFKMTNEEADQIIKRDEGEDMEWGQQLRNTFHMSDVFCLSTGDADDVPRAGEQLERFLALLFGDQIITPTREEYGMYLASAASTRSSSLARQVGAAVFSKETDLIAVGANEVPCCGGGLYWGDANAQRDVERGEDSNVKMIQFILREILSKTLPGWSALSDEEKKSKIAELGRNLKGTRVMNLTEFGRAVHAEMDALSAAGRTGVGHLVDSTLYTTTFPCHNCAKHIVASGIRRVVYVEPYPKSLAYDLHKDSIFLDDSAEESISASSEVANRRVRFEPFVGIAPRRYSYLFSGVTEDGQRLERKDRYGDLIDNSVGIRIKALPLSYIDRESLAAIMVEALTE